MSWLYKTFPPVLYFIAKTFSLLPVSVLYYLSDIIAFVLRKLLGYRKDVILQNLCRAFPDLNYNEIRSLVKKFYHNFSDVFIESIMSNSMSEKEIKGRYRIKNPELIEECISQGKDVIALGGHVSNWEWVSSLASSFTFKCYTLYKPLSNKTADIVINRLRRRFGMILLPMNKAAKFIIANTNENSMYIFIGDQSPFKHEQNIKYTFLNQTTTFFNGGARLAKIRKSAVVYINVVRVSRGNYEIEFLPIAINDSSINESGIIEKYAKLLEENIRTQPANWLWSHKRWKHKF